MASSSAFASSFNSDRFVTAVKETMKMGIPEDPAERLVFHWAEINDGRNKVQSLTIDATGGTFTITFNGQTTSALPYNAPATAVTAALVALSNVAPGDITVTGGPGDIAPYVVTYGGSLSASNTPTITATSSLTGGAASAVVATTVTGVGAITPVAPSGSPYEWDQVPNTGEPTPGVPARSLQVDYAIEVSDSQPSSGMNPTIGTIEEVPAVVTMLDSDYELIKTADYCTIGSSEYMILFQYPVIGLFDVGVHQLLIKARDEA